MVDSHAGAKVEIYDYATKEVVREFERCGEFVGELAFSNDGAMLAVAGDHIDGRVAIYLRDPGDAPAPEPSPSPTALKTPPPTPKQESERRARRLRRLGLAAARRLARLKRSL